MRVAFLVWGGGPVAFLPHALLRALRQLPETGGITSAGDLAFRSGVGRPLERGE